MFLAEIAVFTLDNLSGHKKIDILGIFNHSSLMIHVPAHVKM